MSGSALARARVRHVPAVLGLLAVGCAAGSVAALFVEAGSGVVDTFTWSVPLWFSAGVAALAALLLGLVVDRRGDSIPLALLAVLDLSGGVTDAGRGGAAMPEEPMTEQDATIPPGQVEAGPSTDLVLRTHRPAVAAARTWPDVVVRARTKLMRLRQNPAAMVAVSAAATVGSAVVTAGLRRGLRQMPLRPAGRTASVAIGGYVVHEVHVIHHVVHHVIRPPAAEHRVGGS